jgi:chemotaxis protein CheX
VARQVPAERAVSRSFPGPTQLVADPADGMDQAQSGAIINLAAQVHPQALYSRTGKGTRDSSSGKKAMSSASPKAPSSPHAFQQWQPLLELAVREVFEMMLSCELDSGGKPGTSPGELTAMVGLAGQLCGLVTVRCSAKSAASMASRMLGTEIQPGDKQMFDALGEITNMVAGNFKNKLTGIANKCMLSVPTAVSGSDYSCRSMADTDPLRLTVIFEAAPVTVTVEIHS